MYFDSHAHYDDKRFDKDRELLLSQLPQNGVDYVINSGATMKSSREGIILAEKYDYIYAAVGVHPHDVKDMNEEDINTLHSYCAHEKVVAVGEIGLDYYYDNSPRELQRLWFKRQLELAKSVKLPIIVHSRDASKECFDIIRENHAGENGGVIHCYSGSKEMAKDYIEMGFYIGIGGVITFSNAKTLVEVVKEIPLSKILIETDCPYLSPSPNRGERNDSQNLKYIVAKIAEIKQVSAEEVAFVTKENSLTLFVYEKGIA